MLSRGSLEQSNVTSADWENCWEEILRMPIEPLCTNYLYDTARHLVMAYLSRNGHDEWFTWQVTDAKIFVAEQLALEPDSPEWQRISVVLAGAQAGLVDGI